MLSLNSLLDFVYRFRQVCVTDIRFYTGPEELPIFSYITLLNSVYSVFKKIFSGREL